MKFEESKTKENLEKALQGESLAHMKYQFYRSKIANLSKELEQEFDEIVHNEKEHAKIWFKILHNDEIPDDLTNLKDAMAGEKYEYSQMYPEFASIAEEEGFIEIANLFRQVAEIEGQHWDKFAEIDQKIKEKEVFSKGNGATRWKCLNCGHISRGKEAPEECPVCKHPQKYFTKQ